MTLLALVVVLQIAGGTAAPPPQAQQLFEAGKYDELIQLVDTAESPSGLDRYLAGQGSLKLEPPNREAARRAFGQLGGDDTNVWTFIGGSAGALVDHDVDAAIAAASQAVELDPNSLVANYQLGLVYAEKRNWAGAVTAFEKAATIDPTFAYAHYFAGTANYHVRRVDRMANAFERFIKLAPQAPERPAVEALLRTIRGK